MAVPNDHVLGHLLFSTRPRRNAWLCGESLANCIDPALSYVRQTTCGLVFRVMSVDAMSLLSRRHFRGGTKLKSAHLHSTAHTLTATHLTAAGTTNCVRTVTHR